MDFHYVDTPEIRVSLSMTTGQIRQIIDFLHDANQATEDGFAKEILMSRIMELQSIYEQAMLTLEAHAQGCLRNA